MSGPDPSARIVQKFGGAALRDGAAVERAVRLVLERGGPRPIVVVSALEGVTTALEALAHEAAAGQAHATLTPIRIRHRSVLAELGLDPELCDRHFRDLRAVLAAIGSRRALDPAELDFVLSFGERLSARIVARALTRGPRGLDAAPVDAYDLGLVTDSNHGFARPLEGHADRLGRALEGVHGVPVVTGFLGRDEHGNLTTLGRNGSDYTAALIAEAVGAQELQLWKTVAGVMTADPLLIPEARALSALGWGEAEALALAGAEVLHPESLGPVRRARIPVWLAHVGEARDQARTDAARTDAARTGEARTGAASASPRGTRIAGEERRAGALAIVIRRLRDGSALADRERCELTLVGGPACAGVLAAALAHAGLSLELSVGSYGESAVLPRARALDIVHRLHAELFGAALPQA